MSFTECDYCSDEVDASKLHSLGILVLCDNCKEHYDALIDEKLCISCGQEIVKERLFICNGTEYCVDCASQRVEKKKAFVLEPSLSARNGFARND